MKRIYVGTLLCIILSLGLLTGCDQGVARSLGGDMTLELEPGQKLEMITPLFSCAKSPPTSSAKF